MKLPAYPIRTSDDGAQSIHGVERVIFQILKAGAEILAERPRYARRIFRLLPQDEVDRLETLIASKPLSVSHGYGRGQTNRWPLASIVVSNESTAVQVLGNHLEVLDADQFGEVDVLDKQPKIIVKGRRVRAQLEIWLYADHPDVLLYWYGIVWMLLDSATEVLTALGITPGEIGAGDVAPDGQFIPEQAFVRRITLPIEGDRTYAADEDFLKEVLVRANMISVVEDIG